MAPGTIETTDGGCGASVRSIAAVRPAMTVPLTLPVSRFDSSSAVSVTAPPGMAWMSFFLRRRHPGTKGLRKWPGLQEGLSISFP